MKFSSCFPCSPGCEAIHPLEHTDLPGDIPLKKTNSLSSASHQLSITPQLGVGAHDPLPSRAGDLAQVITAALSS